MRCSMRGGDHNRSDCKKGYFEPSKRPCFNGGELGHRSSQCPHKPVRSLSWAPDRPILCFTCEDQDGFMTVASGMKIAAKPRPTPRNATLADFMVPTKNTFAAFRGEDSDGEEAEEV